MTVIVPTVRQIEQGFDEGNEVFRAVILKDPLRLTSQNQPGNNSRVIYGTSFTPDLGQVILV